MMSEVLAIRDSVDSNLRSSIVALQQQFITLPKLFVSNPTQAIWDRVEQEFTVEKKETLVGREQYRSLYKRPQKRDLSKNKFVVSDLNNTLQLSHGLFDGEGNFTKSIQVLTLQTSDLETDRERLKQIIADVSVENSGVQFYQRKVAELGALVADESLEAEQSRIRILGFVDQINRQEKNMLRAMEHQQTRASMLGWPQF